MRNHEDETRISREKAGLNDALCLQRKRAEVTRDSYIFDQLLTSKSKNFLFPGKIIESCITSTLNTQTRNISAKPHPPQLILASDESQQQPSADTESYSARSTTPLANDKTGNESLNIIKKEICYFYESRNEWKCENFGIPPTQHLKRNLSNQSHVVLLAVPLNISGKFTCEISVEAPSFQTAMISGEMEVVELPIEQASVTGIQPRYRIGDLVDGNCSIKYSKPAANLTWTINGVVISEKNSLSEHSFRCPLTYISVYLPVANRDTKTDSRHYQRASSRFEIETALYSPQQVFVTSARTYTVVGDEPTPSLLETIYNSVPNTSCLRALPVIKNQSHIYSFRKFACDGVSMKLDNGAPFQISQICPTPRKIQLVT
uniref:CD80-like immunoglobulin C2-set domain-containing protein n=1 Tax=Glossina austeni TaxID=7395 RepID=A0A1A9VNS6_GLOAU